MLSVKEKKILKTMDYIIKNKKKDISPYLSKKLNTLTKLKGGSGENGEYSNNNRSSINNGYESALNSEEEVKKKIEQDKEKIQKKYENNTGFKRNEVVKYQNEEYRIKSFLNNSKVEFYNKRGKNENGNNLVNITQANISNIKKLNESDVIMSSDEFLQKSFEDTDKYSNRKYNEVNKILESIFKYEGKSFGGGKSGAKIIGLGDELVFKYSNQSDKKIYKYKDEKDNKIISNRKPINYYKKSSNQKVYNSDFKYIRAIREIYLCKKFDELYKEEVKTVKSESNNNSIESLKVAGINDPEKFLRNADSIYKDLNINKKKTINNILQKHKEKIQKKISDIKLTPEIHYLGFIKNHKIKITEIKNKDVKLSLEQISEEERKEKINGKIIEYDTYLPFIVQSKIEGKPLLNYNKKNLEDDNLKIGILYELLLTLHKFKKMVKKNQNDVGCHRDMHPGNIFIEEQRDDTNKIININARLIDFDLSITNNNRLTANSQCTRNNLSKISPVKHSIATTSKWLTNYIQTMPGKFGYDIIDNDNDLYQYMSIYDKLTNIMNDRNKKVLKKIKERCLNRIKLKQSASLGMASPNNVFMGELQLRLLNYLQLIQINELDCMRTNLNRNNINKINEIKSTFLSKNTFVINDFFLLSINIRKLIDIYPFNYDFDQNNSGEINLLIYKEFEDYFN